MSMSIYSPEVIHACDLIQQASYITALTGAGISTPSGIPDFRGSGEHESLWDTIDPFEVASITAFRKNPGKFFSWVRPLLAKIALAQPNEAHIALAHLASMGRLQSVITQNIDNLHTEAGNPIVFELHGHLRTATCIHCFKKYNADEIIDDFLNTGIIPVCDCPDHAVIKPDVILFGEQLPVDQVYGARREAQNADLLLVVGSSLSVAPANALPKFAYDHGARIIMINQEPTHADRYADVVLRGDVTDILPKITECVDS